MGDIKVYFSDYFDIEEDVIESYGAVNISLINDLPLFIDPFLLFKATPQNTQKERPCGKIPLGRAYIRHSISAAAALI